MKVVDVKEQVRPPLKRCIELVLSGVKYRLFRAAITVAIIALAVAFLMTMLSESLITRRVAEAIDAETAGRRLLQFWVGRLSTAPDRARLNDTLTALEPGTDRWKEIAQWGGLSDEQLSRLVGIARRQQVYLNFFSGLSEGKRRVLIERHRGEEVFEGLVTEAVDAGTVGLREDKLAAFEENLGKIGERFPTSVTDFRAFLNDWYTTSGRRTAILNAHQRAIAKLADPGGPLHNRRPTEFLASAGAGAIDALAGVGFRMPPEDLESLRHEAALSYDAERIERMLGSGMLKATLAEWSGEKVTEVNAQILFTQLQSPRKVEAFVELTNKAKGLNKIQVLTADRLQAAAKLALEGPAAVQARAAEGDALAHDATMLAGLADSPLIREKLAKRTKREAEPVTVNMLLEEVAGKEKDADPGKERDTEGAAWLGKLLGSVPPLEPLGLSAQRIQEVARSRLARSRLAETEASVSQATTTTGFMGFSSRTIWLLVVSFLVCVVGIANAMLMSVTERFREIATIKCLGATDGFIMVSFVMESVMQGIVGGVLGLALGFVLGTLRAWAVYGWIAMQHLPGLDLLAAGGLSIVLGILISALAAVYPAWVAARLAPMEAMRIE